ncbi:MAG: di-trans,poly-cis-decaprenylcistransferase [Clostridia bacterium]|nr:di-trans,poly-cis-decaprenylcistransferase [Clostridia bacterium]MBQ5820506.1 di-trans,poly-cis-decaprenylcistransferase [Clostridia bacterium]
MDGNRRWAKERGLTTPQGHKAGADNLERIVDECYRLGIKHITFYAFSTENWSRPAAEVSALMTLFSRYLDDLIRRRKTRENEIYHHTRIRFLGDMSQFDRSFLDRVEYIEHMSDTMDVRMTMNIALNYGGRADILQAVNRAIQEGVTQLTEQDIADRLYTAGQPDPDLIVRTGGEMRLSNFLLWQASYSEYYSDPCYWPDFDEARLHAALDAYEKRVRKFGGNQ